MSMTPSSNRPFDPFRRMDQMFDAIERSFFEPFGMMRGFRSSLSDDLRSPLSDGFPSMMGGRGGLNLDVQETDRSFELSADLPGLRKEDIRVDVDEDTNVLTLAGERRQEHEETNEGPDGERTARKQQALAKRASRTKALPDCPRDRKQHGVKYHYMERSYGRTARSIRMPETADLTQGSANYENGVLKLSFPKRPAPSSSQRRIQVAGDDHLTITDVK